ncbi:hypothetical protein PVL29_007181 [Vitis rotundifolia]|uniref:Cytochrome c-type biogenesis protein CcmE n=1 Tax=Vitis rotundifolia TaxID=103349 RepID=A0AA39DWD7_VITRO|nr:hypothetical protein PVL29_007181 [Vitis rotundifolia]
MLVYLIFSSSNLASGSSLPAVGADRSGRKLSTSELELVDYGHRLDQFQDQMVFYVTPTEDLEDYAANPSKNMFRLGGLVLEGSLRSVSGKARSGDYYFSGIEVLAKHDEKYMPKEVAEAIERNKKKLAEMLEDGERAKST